jgi:hypothetical protein
MRTHKQPSDCCQMRFCPSLRQRPYSRRLSQRTNLSGPLPYCGYVDRVEQD